MKDYTFKVPQDIVFGVGSLKRLPELLEKSGIEHMYSSVDFSGSAELSIKDPQRYIYLAAKEAARDMTAMI